MKFTTKQIENGIAIAFREESSIARSAAEAAEAIGTFRGLTVNGYAKNYLDALFAGEEIRGNELKTTGCGKDAIIFTPSLAPTIEEHNRICAEAKENEEKIRKENKERRIAAKLEEFNEKRAGWYRVKAEVRVLNIECTRFSYIWMSSMEHASSKMEAYTKFSSNLPERCIKSGYNLIDDAGWSSVGTTVEFVSEKL